MSKKSLSVVLVVMIILTLYSVKITKTSSLELQLHLDNEFYNIGEYITVNGTLTLDGTPITDGLVAIQVNDSSGNLWLVRTRPTGTNATLKQWNLQILEITPLPSSSLDRGDMFGLNITIRNNDAFDHETILVISLFHENGIPLKAKVFANITIQANETLIYSASNILTIPDDTPNGNVEVYVCTLTDLPANGGWAWGLEGKTVITVGSSSPEATVSLSQTSEGSYSLKFRTKSQYALLGNYTIFATANYVSLNPPYSGRAQNSTKFEVILIGDITGPEGEPDGKVDIRDVTLVAYSFGSYPGDPRWNPIADLYPDNKINIRDIAIVAYNYGKIGILPE